MDAMGVLISCASAATAVLPCSTASASAARARLISARMLSKAQVKRPNGLLRS